MTKQSETLADLQDEILRTEQRISEAQRTIQTAQTHLTQTRLKLYRLLNARYLKRQLEGVKQWDEKPKQLKP